MKSTIRKTSDKGTEILDKYFSNWKHAANWCRWASRQDKCKYEVTHYDGVPKQPLVEK